MQLAIQDVPQTIRDFFKDHPRVALAFSGGCDSAYLLACAHACGVEVKAYLVDTAFQYDFELDDAITVAQQIGEPLEVINVDILAHQEVRENPPDRCYRCKKVIFSEILKRAHAEGIDTLIDGTNATDDPSRRPGFRALKEMGVASPLRMAGLTKDEIRKRSRAAGLMTADKPNYSCLATKIPEGEQITSDLLAQIEQNDWIKDRETTQETKDVTIRGHKRALRNAPGQGCEVAKVKGMNE